VSLTFHLIFHTHWDREWYLPEPAFRVRLVGMLDDVLEQLDADSDFRSFLLDGQTVLVEDYLAVRPERTGALREAVRTGRLQIGPWYVLPDEQIPSGESLVRNLLAGSADAERHGARLDVLYSPDAFGHPAMLPDLAREFGIEAGVLWRGLGDLRGDLVRWRGPGGGRLLLYHLPAAGYEVGAGLACRADALSEAWPRVRAALVGRASSRHVAVFVGADHHRVHPAPARLVRALQTLERGSDVRVSRLDEFLRAAGADAPTLAERTGELRWSYGYTWTRQGTHGTRAPLKRRTSALELRLERMVEPLVALAGGGDDLRALLQGAWRTLLKNQFHDTICGTTSDAVTVAAEGRCAEVEALLDELSRRALHRMAGHDPDRARAGGSPDPQLVLWNPAARERSGVVIADVSWFRRDVLVGPPGTRTPRTGPGALAFSLIGPDGTEIPVQVLGRRRAYERLDADHHYPDQDEVDVARIAFEPGPIGGLGGQLCRAVRRAAVATQGSAVGVRGNRMANQLVEATIEAGGTLSLVDRRTGERFSRLLRMESELDAGDTYTWAPAAGDRRRISRAPVRVRVLAAGALAAVLEARWVFAAGRDPSGSGRGRVAARLVLRLHRNSGILHCTLNLDNGAIDHRLRLRLPTRLAGEALVTGTAFGVERRSAVPREGARVPGEQPVATAPAHCFAAVARAGRGLALLVPGFCELEWTPEGDLLLTVLRAVGQLSRADLPTRPGHAGWPEATPLAQCLGTDRLDFAITPVTADQVVHPSTLHALWEDAFLPVAAWWLRDAVPPVAVPETVALEGEGLVLSAIKPAAGEPGMVLRCYNPEPVPIDGCWRFGAPRAFAARVRADEREPRSARLSDAGRVLRFAAAPGEWVTHLVR
jgi:mannosylglycerate hydrolase